MNKIQDDEVELREDSEQQERLIENMSHIISNLQKLLEQEKIIFDKEENVKEKIRKDLGNVEEVEQRIAEIQRSAGIDLQGRR